MIRRLYVDLLYYLLEKVEGQRFEKVEVGHTFSVDLRRTIPKNGKWYQISGTVSAWIRFEKGAKELMTIADVAVYKDGKERANLRPRAWWTFDNNAAK